MKQKHFQPAEDGTTHIRIHSTAATRLGRYLATSAQTPINIPAHGRFASIDAFRIYLLTGEDSRRVRELALSRAEREIYYTSSDALQQIDERVKEAVECKLDQTMLNGISLRELVALNDLPFVSYVLCGDEVVHEPLPASLANCLRDAKLTCRTNKILSSAVSPRQFKGRATRKTASAALTL